MNDSHMKFSQEQNNRTVKFKDDFKTNDRVNVSSGDLKTNQYNSNSSSMKPNLSDDSRRSPTNEDSLKPNLGSKLFAEDMKAFGNPNKIRNLSSSSSDSGSESDSESSGSSSGSSVETEESDNKIRTAQGTNDFFGKPTDEFDPMDSASSGNNFGRNEDTDNSSQSESVSSESSERRAPPMRQKSLEEIAQEKQEMIYRLERMEQNGLKPSRKFTMNSSYDEIKYEYDRLKKQRDVDKSIKFQRKILMAVTSGIEFLNGKFDPFDIKLDGWSESIYENLHEYDDVFEELHEKYKEKVKVAPELKLLMMVGGSAFMFHLTNTLFKSKMPGLGDILQQNPELARNVKQAAMNTMRQNEEKTGNQDPLFSMMMNQAQNMMGPKPSQKASMGPGVKEMRGPSGVDDILSMVNKRPPAQTTAKDEDTVSSVSTQDSTEKRRIKMKKPVNIQKNSKGNFVLDL